MNPGPPNRKIYDPAIGDLLIAVKNTTDEDPQRYVVRRNTELKTIMSDFCDRRSLDFNSTAFHFKGRHISSYHTPYELQMESGDEIDAIFYEKSRHINLIVKGQDEDRCFYKIKEYTKMKKLMSNYCEYYSLDLKSTAFLFNGRRILPEETSYDMEMEDGDEINAIFDKTINLHVNGKFGFEASFQINRNTRLKKLMNEYCCQYDLDFKDVVFLFKGRLVESQQTPNEMGMEDGDKILPLLHLKSV